MVFVETCPARVNVVECCSILFSLFSSLHLCHCCSSFEILMQVVEEQIESKNVCHIHYVCNACNFTELNSVTLSCFILMNVF